MNNKVSNPGKNFIDWDNLSIEFIDYEKDLEENLASIAIVGDIAPVRSFSNAFHSEETHVYGDTLEILHTTDYRIFNLESVLSSEGTPIKKGGPNLKGHPLAINGLLRGKFNLACLANNHIMDFGEKAARDTLNLLEKNNINYVGIGINSEEAKKPTIFSINNIKFGVINCAETEEASASDNQFGANDIENGSIEKTIIDLNSKVDFIILIFHGGKEYIPSPSPRLYQKFLKYLGLGVKLLIGHHPHVPQGFVVKNNSFLAPSIGNFVFHTNKNKAMKIPYCNYGYIVKACFTKTHLKKVELHPYKIIYGEGVQLLKHEEKENFAIKIKQISKVLKNSSSVKDFWNTYCLLSTEGKSIPYFSAMILNAISKDKFFLKIKFLFYLVYRLFFSFKKSKKDIAGSLNYLKNPTHYEFLVDCLELAKGDIKVISEYKQILDKWEK